MDAVPPPPDAQLPYRRLRELAEPEPISGLEPALPGTEPAAFDPIWRFLSDRLAPGEPTGLWLRLTAEILIPVLRENRLGVGEEPVWISLSRRPTGVAGSLGGWTLDWWFNRQCDPPRQCVQPPRQTYRLSVGTQTWPRLILHVQSAGPAAPAVGTQCVWTGWIRAGQGPQTLTGSRRVAEPVVAGRWRLGPIEPCLPEWDDFLDRP